MRVRAGISREGDLELEYMWKGGKFYFRTYLVWQDGAGISVGLGDLTTVSFAQPCIF